MFVCSFLPVRAVWCGWFLWCWCWSGSSIRSLIPVGWDYNNIIIKICPRDRTFVCVRRAFTSVFSRLHWHANTRSELASWMTREKGHVAACGARAAKPRTCKLHYEQIRRIMPRIVQCEFWEFAICGYTLWMCGFIVHRTSMCLAYSETHLMKYEAT